MLGLKLWPRKLTMLGLKLWTQDTHTMLGLKLWTHVTLHVGTKTTNSGKLPYRNQIYDLRVQTMYFAPKSTDLGLLYRDLTLKLWAQEYYVARKKQISMFLIP